MVIGRLRSDDIYNQVRRHVLIPPHPHLTSLLPLSPSSSHPFHLPPPSLHLTSPSSPHLTSLLLHLTSPLSLISSPSSLYLTSPSSPHLTLPPHIHPFIHPSLLSRSHLLPPSPPSSLPTYHRLQPTLPQSTAAQRWRHKRACST